MAARGRGCSSDREAWAAGTRPAWPPGREVTDTAVLPECLLWPLHPRHLRRPHCHSPFSRGDTTVRTGRAPHPGAYVTCSHDFNTHLGSPLGARGLNIEAECVERTWDGAWDNTRLSQVFPVLVVRQAPCRALEILWLTKQSPEELVSWEGAGPAAKKDASRHITQLTGEARGAGCPGRE